MFHCLFSLFFHLLFSLFLCLVWRAEKPPCVLPKCLRVSIQHVRLLLVHTGTPHTPQPQLFFFFFERCLVFNKDASGESHLTIAAVPSPRSVLQRTHNNTEKTMNDLTQLAHNSHNHKKLPIVQFTAQSQTHSHQ